MNGIFENLTTSGKLKAFLAINGITLTRIADLLGVTLETIRNRMADDRWDVNDLKKIAAEYKVEIHDLI
uniref:Putative sigma-70 region domain containing protein n=1 Tax=viral metagenome TaxID=1070528 RepID=A0A6M3LL85_9ZZZZ